MTEQHRAADGKMSQSIIDWINSVSKSQPNNVAVVHADKSLTYGELDRVSNQLANEIISEGHGVGDVIGIIVERSVDLIVSMLAVMKSGAAYAAIDPEYPPERVAQMCAAIPMSLILTTENGLGMRPPFGAPRLHLDRQKERIAAQSDSFVLPVIGPDDLAYVVFTSGSTGTPKATAVHQAGWLNLMQWFLSEFKIKSQDRNLIVSSFSFDITQRAIVMPLLAGGQLHLCPFPTIDADALLSLIESSEITLMNCAPSAFYPLAENARSDAAGRLRWLFLGGEAINSKRIRRWAEDPSTRTGVANVYGTAECSDVSTFHVLTDYARYAAEGVPAGFPISNTSIRLLDDDGLQVSDGESGEIVIAGVGVGKGYINDPAKTAQKFVLDENESGQRLYRTGDIGCWSPDVGLVFEGRFDHQIKIRGNRIDLGDVESTLRQDVRVKDAVALKHETRSGEEILAAFLLVRSIPDDSEKLLVEVRKAMARRAPSFMVPSHIELLTVFPLNSNGKTDRNQLSKMVESNHSGAQVGGGLDPSEAKIAEVFCRILDVGHVGRDDIFFDLGGYSALVTEALADINSELETSITIYDFLSGPTVRELAQHVSTAPVD